MWKRFSVLWLMVKGDVKRLGYALVHPEAPGWLKGGSALLLLYLLSPVDFIPDMIPLLGVMDDAIVIPVVIRWMLKRLPAHIRDQVERRASGAGRAGMSIEEVR
jgi:uncharacterized membrane protein YkvA (DUF1232 family)